MGKWATLSGQVVVHKDKHLSLNKLVDEFLDGEDYFLDVYKPTYQNSESSQDYIYNLDINIEVDGYMAWKILSTLQKVLVEKGCHCDLRVGICL